MSLDENAGLKSVINTIQARCQKSKLHILLSLFSLTENHSSYTFIPRNYNPTETIAGIFCHAKRLRLRLKKNEKED